MNREIAKKIADELNITDEDFEKRKQFLQIEEEDIARIIKFRNTLKEIPGSMFDGFYNHLTAYEETRYFFKDDETIQKLKRKQMEYFEELLSGKYDREYLLSRLSVGYIHVRINIVPLWYIGAYNKYIEEIRNVIDKFKGIIDENKTMQSILKVINLDIILTLESYHYTKYKLQEELKKMIVTDELTGVFNRRKLEEVMQFEIERAIRNKKSLSMLMLDIDYFKKVNDEFGHNIGDQVLKELTELINKDLRETDYFIRVGGEEFVVFLPNTPLDIAKKIAERIRAKVEKHEFNIAGRITISIGATEYLKGDTRDTFFERADKKLYEAKNSGRNRVCW